MAGLFAHVWIANLVLQKFSKKDFISKPENIDDYFFGAVAPDIRYITGSGRDVTHKPKGEKSIFDALKVSSVSMPFIAGYETHLIVDKIWANENKELQKSIYEYYGVNVNDDVEKYSLYLLVDDYFQGESDIFFQISCAASIFKANDYSILKLLGIANSDIVKYKFLVSAYIREPGIDTFNVFNLFPNDKTEKLIKPAIDQIRSLTSFLKEFKKISMEKCLESLEKNL